MKNNQIGNLFTQRMFSFLSVSFLLPPYIRGPGFIILISHIGVKICSVIMFKIIFYNITVIKSISCIGLFMINFL